MARDPSPGPAFWSIRRNGVPALASQRARASPVGPAPTISTWDSPIASLPGRERAPRPRYSGHLAAGRLLNHTAGWPVPRPTGPGFVNRRDIVRRRAMSITTTLLVALAAAVTAFASQAGAADEKPDVMAKEAAE